MPKKAIFLFCFFFSFLSFLAGYLFKVKQPATPTLTSKKEYPLEKYTIENLSQAKIPASKIEVEGNIFSLTFSPSLDKNTKKVTGVINLPAGNGKFPLILLLRGFVDQKIYQSGMGTKKAGEYFSQNGFITLAPDFLGYGGSDNEASNIFESRFQTYVTVLAVLKSLTSIDAWNSKDVFLWGHSNGGQIALTVLEISEADYPTTLWAPVSKPFPYSILYYTDESEDKGKFIRSELAKFEQDYDVEKYSLNNYLDKIKAPLQIHQGTADDAVTRDWSDSLIKELKIKNSTRLPAGQELDINYYVYPAADHNLKPSWDTVIQRDLDFFIKAIR